MLKWSEKQKEFERNATHRWNIKIGAVRSGKTFQDTEHLIPKRIRSMPNKDGLIILLGVTEATLERNILRPMRDKFGDVLVGRISQNKVKLFGEICYAMGAEKISQVSKIQGTGIKYLYIDEVVKIHKEVFDMAKSRLDKDHSICDATGNPEQASHWFKEFLESDADIYVQHYTIDDNPFLGKAFIENLKKEYYGTVLYDRYILGKWVNAEGIIYRRFADNPTKYIYKGELPEGKTIIGIDYGGTKSGQAFVCTRISNDFKKVIVLKSERILERLDDDQLLNAQLEFIGQCIKKYGNVDYIFPDNAEPTHIRSLKNAIDSMGLDIIVRGSRKEKILDRIALQNKLLAFEHFGYIEGECDSLVEAMKEALWNSKVKSSEGMDERLDDFTTDIDTLDAYEYSIERYMKRLINAIDMEISK